MKRPHYAAKWFSKMSLPRELLDQLLSGYLDDSLSADERARVEQLLQSDDEIVKELEARMKELDAEITANARAPWVKK